ncbi:Uncharacterized protein TCM_037863 [Theobroma cacao]|uniref:Uncharacterized protein n=1 Tax=Theobroma cacao TaxID=3641 RepID=A0A061GMM1_THECC|nr:Uncharacterized protein TCM_037863 [Theobroma cacao]
MAASTLLSLSCLFLLLLLVNSLDPLSSPPFLLCSAPNPDSKQKNVLTENEDSSDCPLRFHMRVTDRS